ncbi:sulfatase-like hydrolase/transferase [Algoriphagus aquimarinus]|nr:sulfatase-like hydrolase/transferase [Algoriphagus aquimarinus]|tara:strand:+ start:58285 stop:59556 length:1272 start_codon:yes stop_codon:yes gene_type:complete
MVIQAMAQEKDFRSPNIILIMADDLGYETLGINGSDDYQTPNLDKLAKEGMNFTQTYSMPLCTPSRVQIMTGKYNFRNYIGFGLLKPEEPTFAHYLKQSGYNTFVAGKWQLYGNAGQHELAGGQIGTLPESAGFDEYFLWQVQALGSRYKDPMISSNSGTEIYEGKFGPDLFTEQINLFMEKNRDEPFFIYYPMAITHDPFVPTPANSGFAAFDSKSKVNDPRYFGEMVSYMDRLIGSIVTKTEELGIRENTLILFVGDNGTDRKVTTSQLGKSIKGDKGNTTTAGTHVPFIANWKGKIQPGSTNENLIDFTDFLPTLLETANHQNLEIIQTDGLSFFSQLVGDNSKKRDWIYCYYAPNWGQFENSTYVQDTEWKLYGDGRIYSLLEDPLEENALQIADLSKEVKLKISHFDTVLRGYGSANP